MAWGFPIPMRGNESGPAAGSVPWSGPFPIPMRGNEQLRSPLDPGSTVVPDPHEG